MSKERDLFRAIVIGGLGLTGAQLAGCSCDTPATADAAVAPDATVADAHVESPDATEDDAGSVDAAMDDAGMVLIL
jgi:hypothetical protein